MTNLTQRKRPYTNRERVALVNSLPCWLQGPKTYSPQSQKSLDVNTNENCKVLIQRCPAALKICDFSLNNTTLNTTFKYNINKQHQCSSDNQNNKTGVSKL